MSFDKKFDDRFNHVVRPAIESEELVGESLIAYRVDNSRSGDSILTDIANGIAHSRIILADLSVIDRGQDSDVAVRNGNVMYEVGMALASRLPSEVLLIRDDNEKFLFDVSTIPHQTIDFSDTSSAIETLRTTLVDRLVETNLTADARIEIAVESLTQQELSTLKILDALPNDLARDFALPKLNQPSSPVRQGLERLISKGCIKSTAINIETESLFYQINPFGRALVQRANDKLQAFTPRNESEVEKGE
ncbi:MAG: hypothetical protein RJQ07_04475 [Pseudomonadales bacterium]